MPKRFATTKRRQPAPMGNSCASTMGSISPTPSSAVTTMRKRPLRKSSRWVSLQRAVAIQQRIEAQAPQTKGKLQSVGMGFRENLVGSGTDDLRDALDRRVEFKVRGC